ncbi:MAG: hypothetical protein EOO48_00865 [Flavobacterium sp.]|nr:MAG: hypothetical protein EOO48_00865 [Flavobacterium sp.]
MKTNIFKSVAILTIATAFTACESSDSSNNYPTAAQFREMETAALNSVKQHFTFDASIGVTATSEHSVNIVIPAGSLIKNGVTVTGMVDLEFIEIFDGGLMAVTGKPTRGITPDGKLAMLISGGEFFLQATQNGEVLEIDPSQNITLVVPPDNDQPNPDMSLWQGVVTDTITGSNDAFVWQPIGQGVNAGAIGIEGYYCSFGNFGWTNVDCFYSDPRPKTTILARVPEGYDNNNSTVYLSYDGQGHSLAKLDTYTADGLFSEHYGQIPIGLECHAIFMTVQNGTYKYAIKPVVITDGGIINFTASETVTGTKDQLIAAINAVQN